MKGLSLEYSPRDVIAARRAVVVLHEIEESAATRLCSFKPHYSKTDSPGDFSITFDPNQLFLLSESLIL